MKAFRGLAWLLFMSVAIISYLAGYSVRSMELENHRKQINDRLVGEMYLQAASLLSMSKEKDKTQDIVQNLTHSLFARVRVLEAEGVDLEVLVTSQSYKDLNRLWTENARPF